MAIKGIIFDWNGPVCDWDRGVHPYAERVLRELKAGGYKLGLLSSANDGKDVRETTIKNSGLHGYFASTVVVEKKGPEHYVKCISEMKLTPQAILVVDDQAKKLEEVKRILRCATVWIRYGKFSDVFPQNETYEPDFILPSIEKLPEILSGLG